MKKWFIAVGVIALIGLALFAAKSFAVNATEAINPEAQPIIVYGQSRSLPSRGDSSIGIAKTSTEPVKAGFTGNKQVYNGACRVYSVTIYSDTAGDLVALYDSGNGYYGGGETPATSLEFEIAIAANTSSATVNLFGAKFNNGLMVRQSDTTNGVVGVVYDY